MEIKKYLKAMPVVAALLLTASCSSEDSEIVEAPQPEQARIVPFTVTVNSGSETRATVDYQDYYKFESTDKLWVWNADGTIYGELTGENNGYEGTFTGPLTVEAGASLEASTTLYATIKSGTDEILGTDLAAFKANGFEPNYYLASASFAYNKEDAVRRFSYFKATSTYGAKSFNFKDTQNTSFIFFDITLPKGNAGTINWHDNIYTVIKNGSNSLSGNVEATMESAVAHAQFYAGFPSGELKNPTIKLGDGYEIAFGGTKSLAANKVNNVTRTYTGYQIALSATVPPSSSPVSKTITNIELPYNKTMAELLTMMSSAAAGVASTVSACSRTSGENVTVSGDAPDFSFSATDAGTSVFNVTLGVAPYAQTIDDLTVTVTKVQVVTP